MSRGGRKLSDPLEFSQNAEGFDEDGMLADDLVKRGDESFKPIVTHEGELAVPEGSLPALTAFARTTDRTAALRAGFRAHLPKPLDIGELLAVIASVRR